MRAARCTISLLFVTTLTAQEARRDRIETLGSIEPTKAVAAHVVHDIDDDGRAEIVILGEDGSVTVWRRGETAFAPDDRAMVLPRPRSSVVTFADVLPGPGRDEMIVADARGVAAYPFDVERGAFRTEAVSLTPSRLAFRTGRPVVADLARDINDDGRVDLVVPASGGYEIWLRSAAEEVTFDLAQTLPLEVERSRDTESRLLSDSLRNSVEIPRLNVADVNGDGRADLSTEDETLRRFYLQDADGRFATEPITVDLAVFRDTTPVADIRPGETLVIDGVANMQSGDLDGDDIPDYVVAHRRKVWSFLSSTAGPQFTESRTRRVAQDISGLALLELDDDGRDDLVIFKLDLPSTGELVLGLVSEIDISVTAIGYPTGPDGAFARQPKWKRTLTLRTPSIRTLLSEADDLIDRFLAVIHKLRWSTRGDFDGDGTEDLALATEDDTAAEIWLRPPTNDAEPAFGRWFRRLLFEDPDTVFDVDRLLLLVGQVIEIRNSSLTESRAPNFVVELPPRQDDRQVIDLLAADFDGDGRDELVIVDAPSSRQGDRRITVCAPVTKR